MQKTITVHNQFITTFFVEIIVEATTQGPLFFLPFPPIFWARVQKLAQSIVWYHRSYQISMSAAPGFCQGRPLVTCFPHWSHITTNFSSLWWVIHKLNLWPSFEKYTKIMLLVLRWAELAIWLHFHYSCKQRRKQIYAMLFFFCLLLSVSCPSLMS